MRLKLGTENMSVPHFLLLNSCSIPNIRAALSLIEIQRGDELRHFSNQPR